MSIIALIPARSGSKGIPGKNFRKLGGRALWMLAVDCARASECDTTIVSSDKFTQQSGISRGCSFVWDEAEKRYVDNPGKDWDVIQLPRPAELAQDDTPMIEVVKHLLEQLPGQPDDIIVLLQPTQPFRTPARVREAITVLQSTGADSVVSVVPLPLTHHPDMQLWIHGDRLYRGAGLTFKGAPMGWDWDLLPARRQDVRQTYIRDGSVYAFRRKTLNRGTIYGQDVRPLILEPHETCEMDTEADWDAVQARWEREHA